MPWRLKRRELAARWGMRPSEVDELDWREVAEEMEIEMLIDRARRG